MPPAQATPAPRRLSPQRAALLGLLANVSLALVKLAAGVFGHSYALIADAAESMTDIVGSAVLWGGLKYGAKPADEEHPYGHGKAEALAGLVVAAIVIGAALGIAAAAVHELLAPRLTPAPFTLLVLVAVIIIKESLFRSVLRIAKDAGSAAAYIDAWHHRSDAISSGAAFVGISIALIGAHWGGAGGPGAGPAGGPASAAAQGGGAGWDHADDWAAIVAAGVILLNGLRLLMTPIHELMDTAPAGVIERARVIASSVRGVRAIEKVMARRAGTHSFLDMHVQVEPAMSVRDAHAVAHAVKDAIRTQMPDVADVMVHIEPYQGA